MKLKAFFCANSFVILCMFGALLLRVFFLLVVDVSPVSDFAWYYERGADISLGRGYSVNGTPTAFWPVGYPVFLGLLFVFTGPSVVAAQVLNLFFSLLVLWLSYQIAARLFSVRVARVLLILLSLYPNQIMYCALVSGELLFLALLLLASWIVIQAPTRLYRAALLAGLLLGLACYIKPQAVLVPVLFLVLHRDKGIKRSKRLISIFLALTAEAVILSPWIVRNYQVFGHFVFVSTNSGINLWMGNNPTANGAYRSIPESLKEEMQSFSEYERDQKFRALAVEFIKENPQKVMRLWGSKLIKLYYGDNDGVFWIEAGSVSQEAQYRTFLYVLRSIARVYYIFMVGLFFLAILYRRPMPAWVFWMVVYFSVIYLPFFGGPRFHFATIPWIMMYGASLFQSQKN
jgi:hypothetical protein